MQPRERACVKGRWFRTQWTAALMESRDILLEGLGVSLPRSKGVARWSLEVSYLIPGSQDSIMCAQSYPNQRNTCQYQLGEHRISSIFSKKSVDWGRPCKDKWGFLWLVSDGEACRDTSVWLKYRDQTVISKPISLANLHRGPWISLLPTLNRAALHLFHRTSLQSAECISSLHSRLNKLPSECSQWRQKWQCMGVFFFEGWQEGRKELKMINDQNLEEKTHQPICADFLLSENGENPWIIQA